MLKNRTKPGAAIDNGLLLLLRKLAEKTRIPLSRLLDEAVEDLLVKHGMLTDVNKIDKKKD